MKHSLLLASAMMAIVSSMADTVTLTKSDKEGTVGQASSFMSSFLTNPAESGYGWSDGKDPTNENDYAVMYGRTLRTPCEALDTTTKVYTFPATH